MFGWRGFGLLELVLVLGLVSLLSAGLLQFAQYAKSTSITTPALQPNANSRAELQLLRLQAQHRQLLWQQQQGE